MTNMRKARLRPAVRVEVDRDDLPQPNCDHWLIDTLLDVRPNSSVYQDALRELADLCPSCPLRETCHRDNADEPWLQAILGNSGRDRQSSAALAKAARNRQARSAQLKALVARGASMGEVCAELNVTRVGLGQWCRKNEHLDEWHALLDREKGAAA